MKHVEKFTPIAAATSAVATLLCCVPVGFAAAAATGSLGAVVSEHRPLFLGTSVVLLLVGGVQVTRTGPACRRRSLTSLVILAASALIVLLVIAFPQVVATILADWLP